MRITGNRIRRAFENITPDVLNADQSHDISESRVVASVVDKKNIIPFVLQKIAAGVAVIALLIGISTVALMILNSRTNPQLSDDPTQAQTSQITVLPMIASNGDVDALVIEQFLLGSKDCNFEKIKINHPDILSNLKNVTPNLISNKCAIYRFSYTTTALEGETFLIYDGNVYHLGSAWGGYGITEFAYVNYGGKDILYFIYSWGSGIHRSHIGAFDFHTKQLLDYTDATDIFMQGDITFHLSEDKKTLGIARANIIWADKNMLTTNITKNAVLQKDISILDFKVVKPKYVFHTENIKRISFSGFYGSGRRINVPEENMADIIAYLETFTFGDIAVGEVPPGTDTIHIEIEYEDGSVIKHGMNTVTLNGLTYYISGGEAPDCYDEILAKTVIEETQ